MVVGVSCFNGMAGSTRVKNLLYPLIDENHAIAHNLIYEKDAISLTEKEGKINKVNFRIIGFSRSNPFSVFSFYWRGLAFIKRNKSYSQKNILYHYDQPDIRSIFFIFYAKLIGYKICLDIIEDNRLYTNFTRILTKFKIKSSIFFLNHMTSYANCVLAISEHLYSHMQMIGKGKLPVHLIPITVDLGKFQPKEYNIPQEFRIFYGGSFAEKDGVEYLLKAFEKINALFQNTKLVLTGKGADENMAYYSSLIDKSTAKEKINFMGYLSSDEYYRQLNSCDIFCMTRIDSKFANAGFPFKLGEYLATGKAVIATNVGDVSKYIQNKKNALLINASSVDEIINAITFVIENPEQIKAMGTRAKLTAEKYFDSNKMSLQIFKILNSL